MVRVTKLSVIIKLCTGISSALVLRPYTHLTYAFCFKKNSFLKELFALIPRLLYLYEMMKISVYICNENYPCGFYKTGLNNKHLLLKPEYVC